MQGRIAGSGSAGGIYSGRGVGCTCCLAPHIAADLSGARRSLPALRPLASSGLGKLVDGGISGAYVSSVGIVVTGRAGEGD